MITLTWLATLRISWQIDLPTYKRTNQRLQRTDYTRTSWRTEKRTTMIYLLLTLCLTCTGSAQDVSPEAWFIPGGKTSLIHNSWTLIMSIKLENYNVHFKRLDWETQEFRRSVKRQLISATTNRTEFNDYKTTIMCIVNQEIDQFQGELIALKRFHSELQTTVCGQRRRNNNRNKRGIFNWFRRQLTSKSTMEKNGRICSYLRYRCAKSQEIWSRESQAQTCSIQFYATDFNWTFWHSIWWSITKFEVKYWHITRSKRIIKWGR